MNIKPIFSKIQLEVEQPTIGGLDLSSKKTVIECGKVVAVGEGVAETNIKVGDKIFFKAWALDVISYEGKEYYFVEGYSEGICAIVTE